MKVSTATILLAAVLSAGCASFEGSHPTTMSEQARCEQSRGAGVWVAAAGACIRGGGS